MNMVTGKELFKILLGIIGRYKRKYRSELTFLKLKRRKIVFLKKNGKAQNI
jgi:hypothetical protein